MTSIRLSKLHIQNFRSFEDETIHFHDLKKPITIIGENNTWKSNIIKAILYWIWQKYIGEDGILVSDFFNEQIDNPISIELNLVEKEEREITKIIRFNTGNNFRDAPKLTIDWSGYYKDNKEKIINRVFFYDFQQVANLLKVKTDFSYTPLWKMVKKIKDEFRWNNALQDTMNSQIDAFINEQITNNPNYQSFKERIGAKLKQNLRNHSEDFELKHTIQDVDKIINGLSFFVQENSNKPLLSVENFWSGFRSLLVFSIFEAISESGEWWNIYIFEEPETFLHENYEEYFFGLLKNLAKNNQVIITTHSKKFIDIFDVGTIIRLRNNKDTDYQTNCKQQRVADNQQIIENINSKVLIDDESQNWEQLLSYPDEYGSYMKAIEPNIWILAFSEKVIIVEWPHDVLAYQIAFWKKIVEAGYPTDSLWYFGINIVCVHNKDLIWPLMYICDLLWTKAFVVFDSDLPKEQTIDESDNYLEEGQSYRNKVPYSELEIKWKQHYTKTIKLISIAKKFNFWFQINCPKIEGVLNYDINNWDDLTYKSKSSLSIFKKLEDKTYAEIMSEFPEFISIELDTFVLDS